MIVIAHISKLEFIFKFGMWRPLSGGHLYCKIGAIWNRYYGSTQKNHDVVLPITSWCCVQSVFLGRTVFDKYCVYTLTLSVTAYHKLFNTHIMFTSKVFLRVPFIASGWANDTVAPEHSGAMISCEKYKIIY